MAISNIPVKQEGDPLTASEVNQINTAINAVDVEARTVSHAFSETDFIEDGTTVIDGVTVPVIKVNPALFDDVASPETGATIVAKVTNANLIWSSATLPPVYFDGVTGTGTQNDPYTVSGGSTDVETYLKGLPGYEEGIEKILYGGITLNWGAVPTGGSAGQLATPAIIFGTLTPTTIPMSWVAITNATGYIVQRSTSSAFTSPVTVYSGNATSVTDSGLTLSTHYYYRIKASGSGWTPSEYGYNDATTPADGESGLTPVTTWIETIGFIATSNNLQAPDDTQLNQARSSAYLPAGVVGSVQCTGYGRLGLDDNPGDLANGPDFNFALNANSGNNQLSCSHGSTFVNGGNIPGATSNVRVRLRVTSDTVFYGYSTDGSTWIEPINTPRIAGIDLYVKANEGSDRLDKLLNILGSGLLINESLT